MELFHLDEDLGQSKDTAAREPDRACKVKAQLQAYLKEGGAQLPTPDPNYGPAKNPVLHRRNGCGEDD